jgi:hypothetical protein
MDGLIPYRDAETNEKLWYKDNGSGSGRGKGRKRKMIPDKYRRMFTMKQIVCVEYSDLSEEDEREIFRVSPELVRRGSRI